MALSSYSIGRKVGMLMNDIEAGNEFERTTINEIARYIIEACLKIVQLKPTELTRRVSMLLTAGSTRQNMSGAAFKDLAGEDLSNFTPLQLLDVSRNMGADGATPGRAIIKIDPAKLDILLPDWHTLSAEKFIRWAVIDEREPKAFQVCHKAPATAHYVELLCSRQPVHTLTKAATSLSADDSTADLDADLADELEEAIVEWVTFRALLKDGTSAVNETRAAGRLQAFGNAIGVEMANDKNYMSLLRRNAERERPPQ